MDKVRSTRTRTTSRMQRRGKYNWEGTRGAAKTLSCSLLNGLLLSRILNIRNHKIILEDSWGNAREKAQIEEKVEMRSKFQVTELENPRSNFIRTTVLGSVKSAELSINGLKQEIAVGEHDRDVKWHSRQGVAGSRRVYKREVGCKKFTHFIRKTYFHYLQVLPLSPSLE